MRSFIDWSVNIFIDDGFKLEYLVREVLVLLLELFGAELEPFEVVVHFEDVVY